MIITAVDRIPKQRGRLQIRIDGLSSFDLSTAAVRAHGLKPGRTIDAADVRAMLAADQQRVALDTAVAMLARRPHSEREVRQRLARQKRDPAVIDETVVKLRTARLLDDAEYARAWVESRDRLSPRGQRLLVQELRANGVAAEIAQAAAAEVSDDDAASRAAIRRSRAMRALDHDAFRDKLGAFLQRRGFGWETCRAAIDRCWRDAQVRSEATADEWDR